MFFFFRSTRFVLNIYFFPVDPIPSADWLSCQLLDDVTALEYDTDLLAHAVAEAADFPELAEARAHLARLRLRVV